MSTRVLPLIKADAPSTQFRLLAERPVELRMRRADCLGPGPVSPAAVFLVTARLLEPARSLGRGARGHYLGRQSTCS